MKIGIAGPGAAAGAREPTCSRVAADGTAIPPAASSLPVQGPAQTIAARAVTVPVAVRIVTPRPSSAMPVTGTPVRTSPAPAARARHAPSALITQDSGATSAGAPTPV